jgi:hypothetical protein
LINVVGITFKKKAHRFSCSRNTGGNPATGMTFRLRTEVKSARSTSTSENNHAQPHLARASISATLRLRAPTCCGKSIVSNARAGGRNRDIGQNNLFGCSCCSRHLSARTTALTNHETLHKSFRWRRNRKQEKHG